MGWEGEYDSEDPCLHTPLGSSTGHSLVRFAERAYRHVDRQTDRLIHTWTKRQSDSHLDKSIGRLTTKKSDQQFYWHAIIKT